MHLKAQALVEIMFIFSKFPADARNMWLRGGKSTEIS